MIDLRFPNITGSTEKEQLSQVKTYLHQLVEQLNWALSAVESAQGGNTSAPVVHKQGKAATSEEAESTFNSIKALIIKSADIVKAYEETILTNFNGKYFADSDFGSYLEETSRTIAENSKDVTETFENIQVIDSRVEGLEDEIRTTNAYIKRGHLYYDESGKSVVGIEVGETNKDGAFTKYARFISDRLSFFDVNGDEVAYIGAGCLYVRGKTVFLGEIQLGGYKTDTQDGLAFTWIG